MKVIIYSSNSSNYNTDANSKLVAQLSAKYFFDNKDVCMVRVSTFSKYDNLNAEKELIEILKNRGINPKECDFNFVMTTDRKTMFMLDDALDAYDDFASKHPNDADNHYKSISLINLDITESIFIDDWYLKLTAAGWGGRFGSSSSTDRCYFSGKNPYKSVVAYSPRNILSDPIPRVTEFIVNQSVVEEIQNLILNEIERIKLTQENHFLNSPTGKIGVLNNLLVQISSDEILKNDRIKCAEIISAWIQENFNTLNQKRRPLSSIFSTDAKTDSILFTEYLENAYVKMAQTQQATNIKNFTQ